VVAIVDVAGVRVGRLNLKHVVDAGSGRPAGIDGGTPLPLQRYPGHISAKDPA